MDLWPLPAEFDLYSVEGVLLDEGDRSEDAHQMSSQRHCCLRLMTVVERSEELQKMEDRSALFTKYHCQSRLKERLSSHSITQELTQVLMMFLSAFTSSVSSGRSPAPPVDGSPFLFISADVI